MVCWGIYGQPDEISDTRENAVKLACRHWIRCNCIRSLVNKKHAPKFKLENRCPKCRRELFQSKTDERLFALRDDILEARRRVVYSTWDTRETLLSKESVKGILCGLDGIINRGAEIGDVYDHEEYLARDAFNGALVVNWWKCMMENHLVYFMHTMAEPVTHALMQLVRQHGLCTYDADGGVSTNPFVEIRIGLDEVEAHAAAYSRFYEFFFTAEQGRSGRPSSRSDVIDNSMMPSQLFLKTMVLLQRQLAESELGGDEWDLLKMDKGDQSHFEYKKLCLLAALEVAMHPIYNGPVEQL